MKEGKRELKDKAGRFNSRCSNCGSKFTYVRFKDNMRICRSCGYMELRTKGEKK